MTRSFLMDQGCKDIDALFKGSSTGDFIKELIMQIG